MMILALTLCLLTASPVAQDEARAEDVLSGLQRVDWTNWERLPDLLAAVRAETGVPALAAAYVRGGVIVASATVGVRSSESDVALDTSARFHLGSVTKSFTAVVVGKLVDDGILSWDTRVADVLEGVPMRPEYADVTLDQLLRHTGGLHAFTDGAPPGAPERRASDGTGPGARAAFLASALAVAPASPAGSTPLYSNAGFVLAGHMAEVAAGTSWEQLVREIVFEPLGMKHAGFGIPERPSGHVFGEGRFLEVPRDAYPQLEGIAPAGNVHCSADDLARYLIAHLRGVAGADGIVRADTMRRLHTDSDDGGFAAGWMVRTERSGEEVQWHGGTVGASYAEVRLHPAAGSGALVLVAVERRVSEAIANRILRAMDARFGAPSSGFVSAGDERPGGIEIVEGEATAASDALHWRIVEELSRALNDEDRDAYLAHFAASYDRRSAESMFDFMARNVMPVRGPIEAFHELSAPMKIGGDSVSQRFVTFHLENGTPGYFGLELDKEDRIVELSLFVKTDLCPNGVDPACALVARRLR